MFSELFNRLGTKLISIGEKLTEQSKKTSDYFPKQSIGEIRPRQHRGKTAFFLVFTDDDGKRASKYLSRDRDKAEKKAEELSGFLN